MKTREEQVEDMRRNRQKLNDMRSRGEISQHDCTRFVAWSADYVICPTAKHEPYLTLARFHRNPTGGPQLRDYEIDNEY